DLAGLRGKHLMLAGAGNLGSYFAALAARAGVGRLDIVDRDHVDTSNLVTQDFRPQDVGRSKAEVLAEQVRSVRPGGVVESYATDLEDMPLGRFGVDLLVGALDSRRARQVLVSEIAWPLGVPVVDGAVGVSNGLVGRVQAFAPGPDSACLECTFVHED